MARVLIAEDENNIRNFVKEALEIDDHEVTAASNGKEALEALEQRTFDVLITDLKMPHVGGIELATKAKEILPDMQLIIMTAYGSVQTAVQAMKMGALDYLQKPLKLSELRALVRRAEERARIARDLARGYTFETEFERVTRYRICRANKDTVYPCWETDMQPVTKRVPVDAEALQARDAELARALPGLRATAERDTAQCRILYPETETAPEDA